MKSGLGIQAVRRKSKQLETGNSIRQATAAELTLTRSAAMAAANCSGEGSHRKPVLPCSTLSMGPPLLHAITGRLEAMASRGTMPKCSRWGV